MKSSSITVSQESSVCAQYPRIHAAYSCKKLSTAIESFDGSWLTISYFIHQLKLHFTTAEDLTAHVVEELATKYPESTITIPGVQARLESLQCSIQSIICTIRKQYDSITVTQINNAIGILQSSKIIAVNDKIASVTPSEKQFLTEISS